MASSVAVPGRDGGRRAAGGGRRAGVAQRRGVTCRANTRLCDSSLVSRLSFLPGRRSSSPSSPVVVLAALAAPRLTTCRCLAAPPGTKPAPVPSLLAALAPSSAPRPSLAARRSPLIRPLAVVGQPLAVCLGAWQPALVASPTRAGLGARSTLRRARVGSAAPDFVCVGPGCAPVVHQLVSLGPPFRRRPLPR